MLYHVACTLPWGKRSHWWMLGEVITSVEEHKASVEPLALYFSPLALICARHISKQTLELAKYGKKKESSLAQYKKKGINL